MSKKTPKLSKKEETNHLSTLKIQTARLNSSIDNSIGRKFGKIQYVRYFYKSQTKIQFLVENTASNSINNDLFFVVRRLASAKNFESRCFFSRPLRSQLQIVNQKYLLHPHKVSTLSELTCFKMRYAI